LVLQKTITGLLTKVVLPDANVAFFHANTTDYLENLICFEYFIYA